VGVDYQPAMVDYANGFAVLESYDNTDLVDGELTGPSLYVVAGYRKETR
jgi:hypothetical protein